MEPHRLTIFLKARNYKDSVWLYTLNYKEVTSSLWMSDDKLMRIFFPKI